MDYLTHLQLMDLERICPWASSSIPSYCTDVPVLYKAFRKSKKKNRLL